MTERRKNAILWTICGLGLIVSVFLLAPSAIVLEAPAPQTLASSSSQPKFLVPRPVARQSSSLIDRPFLFELASTDKVSGQERERRLQERYQDILDKLTDDPPPKVAVSTDLGIATVTIGGQPFASVLPQDCPEYHSRLPDDQKLRLEREVAEGWGNVLIADLGREALKRTTAYLKLYNYLTLVFFWIVCIAHLILSWVSRRFAKSPLWSLKLLLWVTFLVLLNEFHPALDHPTILFTQGALKPLFYAIICLVGAAFFHQVTLLFLHRYFQALTDHEDDANEVRAVQRRRTLQQAFTFLSRIGWLFLGFCLYLYNLNVDLTAFFAGASLAGVVIGMVMRDVFVDFFNGFNILAEDQFGVGDWIEIEGNDGEVVSFSLRSTQIRRNDGSLATIPNADMRRVRNHSNEFSIVDFCVTIAYSNDVDHAMAAILDEIALLDTEWQEKLLEPPSEMGIETLGLEGILIRVYLKTKPMAHWETHRRLNRRVKIRFDQDNIRFAVSGQDISVRLLKSDE